MINHPDVLIAFLEETKGGFYRLVSSANLDQSTVNKLNMPDPPKDGIYNKEEALFLKKHFSMRLWDRLEFIQIKRFSASDQNLGCLFIEINVDKTKASLSLEELKAHELKIMQAISINKDLPEVRKEDMERFLTENQNKGKQVLYRIQYKGESGWLNDLSYINPLFLSDRTYNLLLQISGDRAKAFRYRQNLFLLIYPEEFQIDKDLLEHQLNHSLRNKTIKTTSNKIFEIDSVLFQQINENLLDFVEEGYSGPGED